MGLSGLFGVIIGVVLVQMNLNRKNILLFSAVGTAVAFVGLGIYGLCQSESELPLVPTICLVVHVLIFNLGYGCLGYPMMAEILPPNARALGLSLIMFIGGLFGFVNSFSFVYLKDFISKEEIFFAYSGINVIGFIYLVMLLPNNIGHISQ